MAFSKGDVFWYVPGNHTPVAYSSVVTSNIITELAMEGKTFREALNGVLDDPGAVHVLQTYIDNGYGDQKMKDLGVK